MLINPLKAFLFVACGAGAAAGTAYVSGALDPYLGRTRPENAAVASLDKAPAAQSGGLNAEPGPAEENAAVSPSGAAGKPRPADAAEGAPAKGAVVAPKFDILRVEPDGSIVVAGKAAPKSTVDIVAGANVLGSTKAADGGDFAIVLDQPLAPGGHELVLRATGEDKVVATSEETAVVSVPETKDGQVLALVERPGEPSKLITVPSPQKVASNADPGKQARPGAATMDKAPGAPAAGAPAAATPAASPEQQSAARETAVTPAPRVEPATPGDAPAAPAGAPAAATAGAAQSGGSAPAVAAQSGGSAPAVAAQSGGSAPAVAAQSGGGAPAAAPPAASDQPPSPGAPDPESSTPKASTVPSAEIASTAPDVPAAGAGVAAQRAPNAGPAEGAAGTAPVPAGVTVDAVEIEGRKVFVAGAAEPGRRVRVYANDILLGDAVTEPSGRFLIETERDLPVGDYIIRADALAPDGAKVVARAAVPFQREPGEAVAAVAPEMPAGAAARPQAAGDAAPAPAASAAANASAANAPAANAPATAAAGGSGGATAADASAPTASPAAPSAGAAGAPAETAAGKASTTAAGQASAAASSASAPKPTALAAGETNPAPPLAGGGVNTEPKLQPVDGSVIIRRGDTLWRISRRVYGRGVRFSTIYLANQDQIADPDRIWPGQVFSVPVKTKEGEPADMTAVKGQVPPAPPKAPL